ncbi:MAG: sigma-54-dependent Fis family transcriptional regulator [Sneathiella sp.]|nr:sigma-54-dependent Fis family transcriptional regulator [Sneathiella sp.]
MTDPKLVFLVDDEEHIRLATSQTLEIAGYVVKSFEQAVEVPSLLTQSWPGVVVTDVRMHEMDGLSLMQNILKIDPEIPVVLITGHGDISMAVEAIRAGAYDFIENPFASETITEVVKRALEKRALVLENRNLRSRLNEVLATKETIIGDSREIVRLRQIIANIADTETDVLIHGETGTGKELIARRLHDQSSRRSGNFVALNCGAVPETLIESELFGHVAGAFTGAQKSRVGKFEHANGGTLFLDEIESMPLNLQVKILRVLQERAIERVGSNELIPLDLRILAATKVDLRDACDKGDFREDLYYRLNVVSIDLPPLRERREDIPLLYKHFSEQASEKYGRDAKSLGSAELAQLMSRHWPGNVRELQNVADRILLGYADLEFDTSEQNASGKEKSGSLVSQVNYFEKSLISQALKSSGGSIKATQEVLGLPRKTLYDKMAKHGLNRLDFVD